jgi:hypothetical protein
LVLPGATSTSPPSESSAAADSGLSTGAIAGIAVGVGAVGLGAIVILIFCLLRRRKQTKQNKEIIEPNQEAIIPYTMNEASDGKGGFCKCYI